MQRQAAQHDAADLHRRVLIVDHGRRGIRHRRDHGILDSLSIIHHVEFHAGHFDPVEHPDCLVERLAVEPRRDPVEIGIPEKQFIGGEQGHRLVAGQIEADADQLVGASGRIRAGRLEPEAGAFAEQSVEGGHVKGGRRRTRALQGGGDAAIGLLRQGKRNRRCFRDRREDRRRGQKG